MLAAVAEVATSLALAQCVRDCVFPTARGARRSALGKAAVVVLVLQGAHAAALRLLPIVHAPATLTMRLTLLILGHCCLCAVEARARRPDLRAATFIRNLAAATIYVLPAYPLLVVAGSAVLVVATSVTTVVGASPASLRWLVDVGSLHGPFIFVHLRLRSLMGADSTLARGQPLLPVVSVNQAEVRQSRLRYFNVWKSRHEP